MKDFYEKPKTTVTTYIMESTILASSNEDSGDDNDTCDCFAHKGKHSKCGEGCHNSGQKDGFGIEPSIW